MSSFPPPPSSLFETPTLPVSPLHPSFRAFGRKRTFGRNGFRGNGSLAETSLQDEVEVPEMSGRFLKVTVADEVEHRDLSRWLENSGVEFKSFMLKQDRPVKFVICGLPSNTEPEDIKSEIEAEGFKVAKISD
ncbi:zinc finger protein [Trichonephila clavipes]|nr:zinc finger protein [Trichonephila clavipes]